MIQRIQTLWLFFASVVGILFFFLPVATFTGIFHFYVHGLKPLHESFSEQLIGFYPPLHSWGFMVLIVAMIMLPLIVIFLYKNRKQQLLLTRLSILIDIAVLVVLFYLTDRLEQLSGSPYAFNYFTCCAPIASIIFSFLALRGITKDEKLIRSTERLR